MTKTKGAKNSKRSLSKNVESVKGKKARKGDFNNNVLNDLEPNNSSHDNLNQIEKDFENILSELGFKISNITSMLKTKIISLEVKKQLTEVLNHNKEAILFLINDLKFKPSNISSILCNSRTNTPENITKLCSNESLEAFKKILSPFSNGIKFSPSNISSILHAAKYNVTNVLSELVNNKHLFAILIEKGFKLESISSILSKSGAKAVEAVQALTDNGDKLIALTEKGFKLESISSILNGSGANVAKAIQTLVDNQEAIFDLIDKGHKTAYICYFISLTKKIGFDKAKEKAIPENQFTEVGPSIEELENIFSNKEIDFLDCSEMNNCSIESFRDILEYLDSQPINLQNDFNIEMIGDSLDHII